MGSYISSYFETGDAGEELSLQKASEILENTIKVARDVEPEVHDAASVPSNTFSTLVGTITHETERNFIIDSKYSFERTGYDFTIGSEVSFDRLISDGKTIVSNVHSYQKGWDPAEVHKSLWSDRVVICKVEERHDRDLLCNPGEIKLSLDKISVEFLPIVGDWLEIIVKTAVDETVINLSGKVLDVVKVLPVRAHMKTGKITAWNIGEHWGVVNNNIYFNRESLSSGYVPAFGDKVVAQIIESEQKRFFWRALSVIPESISKTGTVSFDLKKMDFKESHPGITIPDVWLDFNKLDAVKNFVMTIHNDTENDLKLLDIELPDSKAQCKLLTGLKEVMIMKKSLLNVNFQCVSRNAGQSRDLVLLVFEKFKLGKYINISVNVTVNRTSKPVANVKNKVNNTGNDYFARQTKDRVRFESIKIPFYSIPKNLLETVRSEDSKSNDLLIEKLKVSKPSLFANLMYTNYEDKFHTLLHLEEISDMIAMEGYNQQGASFIRKGIYLTLPIQNLSEKRPSIILGDKVIASESTSINPVKYTGIVDRVMKNEICIIFSSKFHDSCSEDATFNITIIASRVPFVRAHHGVYLASRNLGPDILFPTRILQKEKQIVFGQKPTEIPSNKMLKVVNQISQYRNSKLAGDQSNATEEKGEELKLEWYNKQLNEHQRNAVLNVLWGECRPLPYFIFGPPGTGKTVTLIEIILQIVRLLPQSRLLIAAPSNSAADLLALRLIDSGVLKPGDLVRLIAYNYAVSDNIPIKLVPYCASASSAKEHTATGEYTQSGIRMDCGMTALGRHRITVATCSAAGIMFKMAFPRGNFSHIIVDEAAQATEPDVLIPLSFLDTNTGQAILAGDPMQLGPVIMSRIAADNGLSESYLERLINRFPYIRDLSSYPNTCGYDPRLVTKLLYNYRALPAIMNLYSELFYNGELIPTINSDSPEAALLCSIQEIIPKLSDNQPPAVLFHGVVGENYQTPDSPSWCNPHEVAQVFFYVNELYRLGLKAANIGIITPYTKQVQDIRAILIEAEFEVPKVGTVEDFQGQEFDVIILSTVRSKQEYVRYDLKNCLGFLSNPKRLNVAISRAKSLFIIIGNPNLLCTDIYWRSVIKYCLEYGQYTGCELDG